MNLKDLIDFLKKDYLKVYDKDITEVKIEKERLPDSWFEKNEDDSDDCLEEYAEEMGVEYEKNTKEEKETDVVENEDCKTGTWGEWVDLKFADGSSMSSNGYHSYEPETNWTKEFVWLHELGKVSARVAEWIKDKYPDIKQGDNYPEKIERIKQVTQEWLLKNIEDAKFLDLPLDYREWDETLATDFVRIHLDFSSDIVKRFIDRPWFNSDDVRNIEAHPLYCSIACKCEHNLAKVFMSSLYNRGIDFTNITQFEIYKEIVRWLDDNRQITEWMGLPAAFYDWSDEDVKYWLNWMDYRERTFTCCPYIYPFVEMGD